MGTRRLPLQLVARNHFGLQPRLYDDEYYGHSPYNNNILQYNILNVCVCAWRIFKFPHTYYDNYDDDDDGGDEACVQVLYTGSHAGGTTLERVNEGCAGGGVGGDGRKVYIYICVYYNVCTV